MFRQGMAVCWNHEHALYLDLSCSMPGEAGEHLWAAAGAVLGDSSVRKAGFKLRDQLAALLQHGMEVQPDVILSVIPTQAECSAPSARSSAFQTTEQIGLCCAVKTLAGHIWQAHEFCAGPAS